MSKYKFRRSLERVAAEEQSSGLWEYTRYDANEACQNLPPVVEDRVMGRLSRVAFNRYPDYELVSLKEQIAENFALSPDNVVVGNGADEILAKLFYSFGGRNHTIVYAKYGYEKYAYFAELSEAKGVAAAKLQFDVHEFVAAVKDNKAALAVLANPGSISGQAIPLRDIEYILQNIDCVLAVDESLVEFSGRSAASLVAEYSNLAVVRTFSKAYGLASLRVGYLLARSGVTEVLGKMFLPQSVSAVSLAIADIVYQMRDEYVPRIQMVIAERKRLAEEFGKLPGMKVWPSEANFLLLEHEKAADIAQSLARLRLKVKTFAAPELQNMLRITAGTRTENDDLLKTIKAYFANRA